MPHLIERNQQHVGGYFRFGKLLGFGAYPFINAHMGDA
jgi:hypothetical protein